MSDDDDDDFFSDDDLLIDRDGQGRPLIRQPDGSRLAYDRASGLADIITDSSFLVQWKMRYVARAMGENEDLAALAAAETYTTGFNEDPHTKSASGRRLDGYIERALDRMRINERADYGSVVHALTEPGSMGYEPIRTAIDVHAFWELIEINEIEILGTEVFTVNDWVRAAGTFDHLVRTKQYGVVIADKKTGRNINGLGFAVQFATYANGVIYDIATEERRALETLSDGEQINREVALIFDVKEGKAQVRKVPIDRGWTAAQIAAAARDANEWSGLANIDKSFKAAKGEGLRERAILRRIGLARSLDELKLIWAHYKDEWTEAFTEAGKERMDQL